ncbi:hypothetical protein WJX81_000974 [Elliptochloris bilobata]|uniref:type I protein arginine methyltransferase n=1 Tax=Elliptochloris bilobata TaxID=381761 RepID=A0AAW1QCY8_9CHLO
MTSDQYASAHNVLITEIGDGDGLSWDDATPGQLHLLSRGGGMLLQATTSGRQEATFQCQLTAETVFRATDSLFLLKVPATASGHQGTYGLRCSGSDTAGALAAAVERGLEQRRDTGSEFSQKTDEGSADLYFRYYGLLQHQQNMLQDYVRTGTYYAAILENRADFEGKVVGDIGAGSGILSFFAAQAGARKVYAVEASAMADYCVMLKDANPALGRRIEVVRGRVEEVALPERCDVLVSEPMGTLLVNERMLETFLFARDHLLKPGGRMFPQVGRIHCAVFSDAALFAEVASKAAFWQQDNYYGVDLTRLLQPAVDDYFAQVVVDAIDPGCLVSDCNSKLFDFGSATSADLENIVIPLRLQAARHCHVHGLACWFDVLFDGTTSQRWLSTAPGLPTTHWFQLRCLLGQPLTVAAGGVVTGELRLAAHKRQSYDVHLTLTAPPLSAGGAPQTARSKLDLKEPYYRQLCAWNFQQSAIPAPQQAAAWAHANGNANANGAGHANGHASS